MAQVSRQIGPNHFGKERRESAEQRAERIIAEVLRKLGLKRGQMELLPATRQVKVRLARRLRRETTMSLKWIAEQLGIGSWKYLSNLHSKRRTNPRQAGFGL